MPAIRLFFVSSVSLLVFACASVAGDRAPNSIGPQEHAMNRLRAGGLSEEFVQLIHENYREEEREKVLDYNILGFLRSSKSTGNERIPKWELERVKKFIRAHRREFSEVEKQYKVGKEVIASLLWVETKHGRDLGTYHVASALYSLAQADYPTLTDRILESAKKKAAELTPEIESKVIERCAKKAEWATAELKALQEIHMKGWKDAATLTGSFSGAFGMAQFIPSSYLTWAKGKRQKEPNLFRPGDSIRSVANYLKSNGWERKNRQAQEAALFHYNRDRAYVTRILRMSECLKRGVPGRVEKGKHRHTASASGC